MLLYLWELSWTLWELLRLLLSRSWYIFDAAFSITRVWYLIQKCEEKPRKCLCSFVDLCHVIICVCLTWQESILLWFGLALGVASPPRGNTAAWKYNWPWGVFSEEIEYIMMCVDSNHDGKVDFTEFTDRFHNPAKDIGFTMAVLLTNLSEHMPNEPRWVRVLVEWVCELAALLTSLSEWVHNEPVRINP